MVYEKFLESYTGFIGDKDLEMGILEVFGILILKAFEMTSFVDFMGFWWYPFSKPNLSAHGPTWTVAQWATKWRIRPQQHWPMN